MNQDKSFFNIAQLNTGSMVKIDRLRDELLSDLSKEYLQKECGIADGEYQELFARLAMFYSDNSDHAQRIYDYISKLWFVPSIEIFNSCGSGRKLPISCYINEVSDNLSSIIELWNESVWLSSKGGSVSSYWGGIRSVGEGVGKTGSNSGVIPFIKVQDSISYAVGREKSGAGALGDCVFLPISHPEIYEFIDTRNNDNADINRVMGSVHLAVVISDAFMRAVEADEEWALVSPKDASVRNRISAKDLWNKLIDKRIKTGEPYILFSDNANRGLSDHHKLAGLNIKAASVGGDILLPIGRDQFEQERTSACPSASVNLEKFEDWENHPQFLHDVLRFLDNVIDGFIKCAPDNMMRAKYAAMRERSIALSVFGFYSFLKTKEIPFESSMAKVWNKRIFKHLKEEVSSISVKLAHEKGACPDARDYGIFERFSYKLAIGSDDTSIIAGVSKGVEAEDNIDMRWVIEHAADRAPYICQSQNLKFQFTKEASFEDIQLYHYMAWKKGIKTLNSLHIIESPV